MYLGQWLYFETALLIFCEQELNLQLCKLIKIMRLKDIEVGQLVVYILVVAISLLNVFKIEADSIRTILQPTRDLMPLVGTRAMIQDREGYLWYGTVEGGLCRDNGYQIDVFRNDRHNPTRIGQSNGILALCEDSKGNIIFGTRKNIFVLDKNDYSIRQLDSDMPDGQVTSIECDKNGNITVTTSAGGYEFDRDYKRVNNKKRYVRKEIPANCSLTDRFGNEWTGGINMENSITLNNRCGISKLKGMEIPQIVGHIRPDYIKTGNGYLWHTNTELIWTESISAKPERSHITAGAGTRISCMAVSKEGWLYVGDETGLYRMRQDGAEFAGKTDTIINSIGNIRKMVPAPSGGVYFITPRCALAYCDDKGNVDILVKGNESKALAVSPDGTVWTTDWFGNVYRYDSGAGRLVLEERACIDSGDPVNAMTCDNDNNLWLVTDKMIKEYTGKGECRIIYSRDKRIDVSQFLDIFYNGKIMVRCSDALLSIDPGYRDKSSHKISLTSVSVDGIKRYAFPGNEIEIQSGASHVELFFSTFNHANAGSVTFSYRVDGGPWHNLEAGKNNISFASLQKGKYRIEVKATDADGFLRDESLEIYLNRLPAWWETWWAYAAYLVLTIVLVVVSSNFWRRYRETRRKVAELQERLDSYLLKEDADIEKVADEITDNNADREFISKAVFIVEQNMSNAEFDIDMFCGEMGMSRSSLYRKFADITGQKPSEFVRAIRLKRAAEIIKEGGHSISETAYMCGFSSPSYFNRRFKEMFGTSPTKYS